MTVTSVYLAGPPSRPEAFVSAAQSLSGPDTRILNPLQAPPSPRDRLALMMKADLVVSITGWEQSSEALFDLAVAREVGIGRVTQREYLKGIRHEKSTPEVTCVRDAEDHLWLLRTAFNRAWYGQEKLMPGVHVTADHLDALELGFGPLTDDLTGDIIDLSQALS